MSMASLPQLRFLLFSDEDHILADSDDSGSKSTVYSMPLRSEMVCFLDLVSRPRFRSGHLRCVSGSLIYAGDAV